jgi:hypothetical protein
VARLAPDFNLRLPTYSAPKAGTAGNGCWLHSTIVSPCYGRGGQPCQGEWKATCIVRDGRAGHLGEWTRARDARRLGRCWSEAGVIFGRRAACDGVALLSISSSANDRVRGLLETNYGLADVDSASQFASTISGRECNRDSNRTSPYTSPFARRIRCDAEPTFCLSERRTMVSKR